MRLLLTGAHGQVGWELNRSLMPLGHLIPLDRSQCDLARACRSSSRSLAQDYPTPVARPKNSRPAGERLGRRFGIALPDWPQALTRCIEEITPAR